MIVLKLLEQFKQTENYKLLRENANVKNLINPNLSKEIVKENMDFLKFVSIENSLKEANRAHKKVLLYFSAKYCVTARKMESNIFIDETINSILRANYLSYVLKVDDDINGEIYSKLQLEKFDSNTQPFFVILDISGEVIKKFGYIDKIPVFKSYIE